MKCTELGVGLCWGLLLLHPLEPKTCFGTWVHFFSIARTLTLEAGCMIEGERGVFECGVDKDGER